MTAGQGLNRNGLLVVLPVVQRGPAEVCIESVLRPGSSAGFRPEDLLIIDNSQDGWAKANAEQGQYGAVRVYRDPDGHNLGTARSWNVGAREVIDRGLDYLVIMSAAMQFGPELHCTWVWQMETFWGSHVIEADGHSWHLIAFHRSVLNEVGLFDENFYPAYFEGIDYGYRMRLLGLEGGFRRVWVNALSQGSALTVGQSGGPSCPAGPLLEYYAAKWGGPKGEEAFTVPHGDPNFTLDYWVQESIPELADRYGLEVWW